MWMVELNIAGRRFVHYVPGRRRITVSSRALSWRPTPHRPPTAA
ncbi:hypothetical protein [Mycolicibacterium sp. S2-37]|nr:hypothetical protein [Mycolicibacterium sp. S2-37]